MTTNETHPSTTAKSTATNHSIATRPTSPTSSNRRNSIFSSFLSLSSPMSPPAPRHNSISSHTTSHSNNSPSNYSPSSISSSILTSSTHHHPRTPSPVSSIASPIDPKAPLNSPPDQVHRNRQGSFTSSLSGLTNSLRWPGSSNVKPISIPNSAPPSNIEPPPYATSPSAMTAGSSAPPCRRASILGPSFRRPFELPTYTTLYDLSDQAQPEPAPPPPVDPPTTRRGRSGSVFSPFGVGDAGQRGSGPAGSDKRAPPKRRLSPMGERMIRDHPF